MKIYQTVHKYPPHIPQFEKKLKTIWIGIYPKHFIQDEDFYTYRSTEEPFEKIDKVLSMPDQGLEMAQKTKENLKLLFERCSVE